MIIRLIGGPKDGQEIDFPSDLLGYNEIRIPEPIVRWNTLSVPTEEDLAQTVYRELRYRPIRGEPGDCEFVGYA